MTLRTALFYLLLGLSTVLWCLLSLLIAPWLPQKARYIFIARTWCRFAVWLSTVLLGIRYRIEGAENIPQQPCVILAKHQSAWETFFLTAYFAPLTQVLKQELLQIPFYGGIHSPYIWFECPNGMDSWTCFDYLLENIQVVGTPGAGFGENGKNYFRLTSFGTYESTVEAMNRFKKLFAK